MSKSFPCNCPVHGSKHQLRPSHALCAHPKCVLNLIHKQAETSHPIRHMLKRVYDHGQVDDCVAYVLYRLVVCVVPVLSKQRTSFYLKDFLKMETYDRPSWKVECPFTAELEEALADETQVALTYEPGCHQFNHVLAKQLLEYISETHGDHWSLYLADGISPTDICKLEGLRVSERVNFEAKVSLDVKLWSTKLS